MCCSCCSEISKKRQKGVLQIPKVSVARVDLETNVRLNPTWLLSHLVVIGFSMRHARVTSCKQSSGKLIIAAKSRAVQPSKPIHFHPNQGSLHSTRTISLNTSISQDRPNQGTKRNRKSDLPKPVPPRTKKIGEAFILRREY